MRDDRDGKEGMVSAPTKSDHGFRRTERGKGLPGIRAPRREKKSAHPNEDS